ncbi:MAG: 50S ribosomal protein L29 [Chloroflexi bacterium]|nr:50S ribosomal protein L29 [Chloroflexota bacterium]
MAGKIEEIRVLSVERLKEEENSTRLELLNLRFKVATRQLADHSTLRAGRHRLARILTVLRERELVGGAE